jgi:hypothetical protein
MAQSYHSRPSEIYEVEGATGLYFDQGIWAFGSWVEGELNSAEASAKNEMFARSAKERAFARCMGDDMEHSTAGFADPWSDGGLAEHIRTPRRRVDPEDGELLWSE